MTRWRHENEILRMFNRVFMVAGLMGVLGVASGCASAGRTAAWEKPTTTTETTAASGAVDEVAALEAKAKELWAQRDDQAKLLEAIEAWKEVVAADPNNVDALTMLARAHYFHVDAFVSHETGDGVAEKRLAIYTSGADWGEKALLAADPAFAETMRNGGDFIEAMSKIEKPAVPAAYWYCTNLGRFAREKGLRAKLFYKDRVAAAMKRLQAIAPEFFYAAADRYLGAFYSALPGIAGKDLGKSAKHFDAAIAAAPEYLGNLVVKAEFLAVEEDDEDMYKALLKKALEGPDGDDPNIAPENRAAKRTAEKLLSEDAIDERF